jgi:peptide methionine sulfoxide reductase MsrA
MAMYLAGSSTAGQATPLSSSAGQDVYSQQVHEPLQQQQQQQDVGIQLLQALRGEQHQQHQRQEQLQEQLDTGKQQAAAVQQHLQQLQQQVSCAA